MTQQHPLPPITFNADGRWKRSEKTTSSYDFLNTGRFMRVNGTLAPLVLPMVYEAFMTAT
jgi:hypothetical protein